jgi:putative transposase
MIARPETIFKPDALYVRLWGACFNLISLASLERPILKKRFTEEQIVKILAEAERGEKTIEVLCRQHNVSVPTFYVWKRKFGAMNEPDVKRLRELEKENARLKKLLAERSLEIDVIKEFLEKK